jgi:hypothetical protein
MISFTEGSILEREYHLFSVRAMEHLHFFHKISLVNCKESVLCRMCSMIIKQQKYKILKIISKNKIYLFFLVVLGGGTLWH